MTGLKINFQDLNPSHTRAYNYLRPPATCKTDDHQQLSVTETIFAQINLLLRVS
jgi:hypothetical protein